MTEPFGRRLRLVDAPLEAIFALASIRTTGHDDQVDQYAGGPRCMGDAAPILCWWLELGVIGEDGLVSANVSSSDGDYDDLDSRGVTNGEDVTQALADAVAWLKGRDLIAG